ncbi:MAG TPA: FmdE family protein [Anaerolineales bacterium]
MDDLDALLDISSRGHDHLCPRQILGVRIGLAGMGALGFAQPPSKKRLLVILETDGCFADGVTAATTCSVGHRTLRVEDYGKTAATFVDTKTGRAVRVAPALDVRNLASAFVPSEPRHYFAQMKAYRSMPEEQLLTITEVQLACSVEEIVSRAGVRANCAMCGEEIINEREIVRAGLILCRACAGSPYYHELAAAHSFELSLQSA